MLLCADARSCVTCDKVLEELEKIDDDTDTFGVDFVKINDKRLAKQYGITKFPALTYFREKEPIIYEGLSSLSSLFVGKSSYDLNPGDEKQHDLPIFAFSYLLTCTSELDNMFLMLDEKHQSVLHVGKGA